MALFQSPSERPVAASTSALEAPSATLAMAALTARSVASSSTVSGVVARAAAGAGFGAEVRGEALRPFALRPLLAVGAAADRRSLRAALTGVEVRSEERRGGKA